MLVQIRHDRLAALAAPVDARIFEGRVARIHEPGDALEYSWGKEYRDAAELKSVCEQLRGKTFVLNHPNGDAANAHGMVTLGAQHVAIGTIIDARVDGEHAIAKIAVTSMDGIVAIDSGTHELSLGYQCVTDEDGYQRKTVIDHLALVPKARCGGTCALRADAASDCGCSGTQADLRTETSSEMAPVQGCPCKSLANPLDAGHGDAIHMPPVNEDAQASVNTDGDLQAQLDAANDKIKTLEAALAEKADAMPAFLAEKDKSEAEKADALAQLDAMKVKADAAEVEAVNARKDLEPEKLRADQAEAALKARNDAFDASLAQVRADEAVTRADAVNAKVALIVEASPIVDKAVDLTKLSNREIKLAVIKHVDGDDYSDAKFDDSFVAGVYVGSLKRFARAAGSRNDHQVAVEKMRSSGTAGAPKASTGRAAELQAQNELRLKMSAQWMNSDDTNQDRK